MKFASEVAGQTEEILKPGVGVNTSLNAEHQAEICPMLPVFCKYLPIFKIPALDYI